ncbi:MAG TPA: hypothetical protein VLI41_12470 [Phenylobacterium sp.]|uniref:hypothetical protein n=1 Tax=Phenylobacterium sp. TaxID=1871053 RepID=UPI002CE6047F|nr:hypothetical protein [Phenylobacterium sp.]HSV04009.1 hypothetical protein [Phenylobacterium sp.]
MPSEHRQNTPNASVGYAALRHAGLPAAAAAAELRLEPLRAHRLERLFQARRSGSFDPMKPRYARHGRHVAAVMALGGYPVLPARTR